MPSTPLHQLYHRWLEEVWTATPGAIGAVVAENFLGHWPDRTVTGRDGLGSIIRQTHEMFATLEFEIAVGPIVEGDYIAARWVGTGKNADGLMRLAGNDLMRTVNGKIAEYWVASTVTT
jgi:hypothetical protein